MYSLRFLFSKHGLSFFFNHQSFPLGVLMSTHYDGGSHFDALKIGRKIIFDELITHLYGVVKSVLLC